MKKIIFFIFCVLVFMCTLCLSGCKKHYESNDIIFEFNALFIKDSSTATIDLEAYSQTHISGPFTSFRSGRHYLGFTVSNDGIVDTSLTGKQTFTINFPDKNACFDIDIYVIELNSEDKVYYSNLKNSLVKIICKQNDGKIYLFDSISNSYSNNPCTMKINSRLSGSYDSTTNSLHFDGSSNIYKGDLELTDTLNAMTLSFKFDSDYSNEILFDCWDCKEEDVLYIVPLENTYCESFYMVMKDNHLSDEDINNVKIYGTLTLDEDGIQVIDNKTIINQNTIYIYDN